MPKKFVLGPFYVSKNFWHRTISRIKNREHHNFPSKICYLTVSKNIVGETFCASEKKLYRNILWISGGKKNIHNFSQKISVSYYWKIRWKTLLCFRNLPVSKKVCDKRGGGFHDFPKKLFCLTVPEHFVEEPLCVSEIILVSKIFMDTRRGGCITFFCHCFWLTIPKNVVGEPLSFQKKSGIGKFYG